MFKKNDFVICFGLIFKIVNVTGHCLELCNDDFPQNIFVSDNLVIPYKFTA